MILCSLDTEMANPNISRALQKLGFFFIEERPRAVFAGHLRDLMIEAVILDDDGEAVGGPYADLVGRISRALEQYDAGKDDAVYGSTLMREQFFEKIAARSGLPLELVCKLTK